MSPNPMRGCESFGSVRDVQTDITGREYSISLWLKRHLPNINLFLTEKLVRIVRKKMCVRYKCA